MSGLIFQLANIQITDLRELELRVAGLKQDMMGFLELVLRKNATPDSSEIDSLAHKVYPRPGHIKAERFANLVLSIQEQGYKVLGINSGCRFYEENFGPDPHVHPLVTIKAGSRKLIDGNHRAMTLLVLGTNFFPVIQSNYASCGSEAEYQVGLEKYKKQYAEALPDFLSSQEWKDYKKTNCYKVAFK